MNKQGNSHNKRIANLRNLQYARAINVIYNVLTAITIHALMFHSIA